MKKKMFIPRNRDTSWMNIDLDLEEFELNKNRHKLNGRANKILSACMILNLNSEMLETTDRDVDAFSEELANLLDHLH